MIINILIILWFLFLLVAVMLLIKSRSKGVSVYTFSIGKVDIPYITISIQGIELNMIVDTGCGVSMMCRDVADKFEKEDSSRKISLQAITDDSVNSNVITLPLTINKKSLNVDFALIDAPDFGGFVHKYGFRVHGILGVEFLETFKGSIDFDKHTITFM